MFLPRSGICDEITLEGLVDEVGDDGLRDLNPRSFNGYAWDVVPHVDLSHFVEFQ